MYKVAESNSYQYDNYPIADSLPIPPMPSAPSEPDEENPYEAQVVGGEANGRFDYTASRCRDPLFACLFLVHLGALVVCAIVWGPTSSENFRTITSQVKWPALLPAIVITALAAAIVAVAFSALWLKAIRSYASIIVQITLIGTSVMLLIASLSAAFNGATGPALAFFLLGGLNALYYYLIRDRIPFTQAILAAASESVADNKTIVVVAFVLALVQVLWIGFWLFTSAAVMMAKDGELQSSVSGIVIFLFVVSFLWTTQVIQNVSHVTAAGVVASWWLLPPQMQPKWVTLSSLKRATTTSFGSICLGSLLVAFLGALRSLVRSVRESARRSDNFLAICVFFLLDSCMSFVEWLVRLFNVYAFTQVAVYGKSFVDASKSTWEMFRVRGWEVIINDQLTGMVLAMGSILGGLLSTLAALLVGLFFTTSSSDNMNELLGLSLGGFVVGFTVVSLVTSVVYSAACTTIVLWAESPEELQRQKPEFYQALVDAGHARFPNARFDGPDNDALVG